MKELNYLTTVATRSSDYFILFVCLFVCFCMGFYHFYIFSLVYYSCLFPRISKDLIHIFVYSK